MGTKDTLAKRYLSQNEIFADAFNYYFFKGEKVINPDDLIEQDPTESAIIRKMNKVFTNQKIRDVLKSCTIKHSRHGSLVLLGIEAQAGINYAMPVRDYLYDALNYASQVADISKKHEENDDLSGNEKISGFSKNDRILPVITLCICFDKDKWDAPRRLSDMFSIVDPRISEYINDYKLNLITPHEIEDFSKFSSELGTIMEFIHVSDDKAKLRDIIKSRAEESIHLNTVDMINTYVGTKIPTRNVKGGKMRVCQAFQELLEDERAEGREEGREEGADMLAKLLKVLTPGSKDYDKALNATAKQRNKLYKKYGIIE
ncbi:Putative transposase, YhgA-like [Oribacterium sp. KHPX15]|uniref:Rpn family recombination-promoting nuclease/putative transposase n=1 Tax=Oribacterium sp. KHPX15 TaxID=1855342 RepID=UPI0008994A11|nr:Rpn family recombination-promoting nuclease/putative transposase [Oribacterium sp. KHPX15]SEA57040.1 Putative transposase, YhgA-like [Oribacterium sp. KHPX15]